MNLHKKLVFPGAAVPPTRLPGSTALQPRMATLGAEAADSRKDSGRDSLLRLYGYPCLLCTPVSLLLALASPPIYPPPPLTTILITRSMAALCFSSSCLPPPPGKLSELWRVLGPRIPDETHRPQGGPFAFVTRSWIP